MAYKFVESTYLCHFNNPFVGIAEPVGCFKLDLNRREGHMFVLPVEEKKI